MLIRQEENVRMHQGTIHLNCVEFSMLLFIDFGSSSTDHPQYVFSKIIF